MLKAGLLWTPFERSKNASHSLDIFRPTCWKSRITFWSIWIGRCGDRSWDSIENTEKAFFLVNRVFFSAIELNFRLTKRITFYMGGGCRYKQAWYDFVVKWPLKCTVSIAIYCAIQYVTPKYHTLQFKKQQEPIGTWRLLFNLLSAHGGSCGLFGCFGPHVEHCGQGLSIFLQKVLQKTCKEYLINPAGFQLACIQPKRIKKVRILFAPSLRHQLLSKASGIWHQLLPRQRSQAANQSHERNASKSIQMPCLHRSGFCVDVFVEDGQGHENATAIHNDPQISTANTKYTSHYTLDFLYIIICCFGCLVHFAQETRCRAN